MREAGFEVMHAPILDQRTPSLEEMRRMVAWIGQRLEQGKSVMVHCVGGLGRSGLAAACYLRSKGADCRQALDEVRRARSPRAVETQEQERFVCEFEQ